LQEALGQATDNEPLKDALEGCKRQWERVEQLLSDFEDFGAQAEWLRSGELPFVKQDINALVREGVAAVRAVAPEGVTFDVDSISQETWLCECEPGQFGHALSNVLRNGIEAILRDKGEGTITVGTRLQDQQVEIRVGNTGPPIPEPWERIFDPFFSVSPEPRPREHSGLGLSIARSVFLFHNGSIKVESSSKEGTTFLLTIPLVGEGMDEAEEERSEG
jgi:signal transduction histidine kinase